jgi:3-isopropylmalate/(R)-2-methylmalate dehydratase small subunit
LGAERIREIRGTPLPVRGNDIDTDRIIPARFLKSITFDGLQDHLFADDRVERDAARARPHPVADPAYAGAAVMLVNANFGCGSSREHAPQAIRRRGIRAVIGESFSEIFFGNAVALGMPCATAATAAIEALMALAERDPAIEMTVDLSSMRASAGDEACEIVLPPAVRDAFLDGSWDATGLLLENFDEVRGVAARLPYSSGFAR